MTMGMKTSQLEIRQNYPLFSAKFNNRLLELLIEKTKDNGNIAISPSRIQTVLVLLANWSSPKIREKILDVVGSEKMKMDEANVLCDKEHLNVTPWDEDYKHCIPTIESQTLLWVKEGLGLDASAINCVSPIFDLSVKYVNFSDPETKIIIDKAVEELSHGLIKEIQTEIQPLAQLLLTDILYFKAKWVDRFQEENTQMRLFYGTKGEIKVPMMHRRDSMMYCETQSCQIVQLRYMCMSEQDKLFSMRIFLPKKSSSIADVLHEIRNVDFCLDLRERKVDLSLPRFSIESNVYLKDVLKDLGLECIYESMDVVSQLAADIQISEIAQQVKIIVNENETEAAALTQIVGVGALPTEKEEDPIVMNVNRPFMFEIVEEYSNTILFSGIIKNFKKIVYVRRNQR